MPPSLETAANSNQTMLKLGRQLVPRLAISLRTTKLYDSANVNVMEAARDLVETVRSIHRMEGRAQLALILDFLTLNDVRLKTNISGHATFRYLIEFFHARRLGAIQFGQSITAEELIRFCRVLHDAVEEDEDPYVRILDGMQDVMITSISTEVLDDLSDLDIESLNTKDFKQRSIRTFFHSIRVAREILVSSDPKNMRFKRAKRVVQQIVDLISEDESVLLSLTSIKNHDEYTYNHSANVAVYCIAFGQKMGFEKKALADLGMAGMFHDVGKTRVPKEILNKPGRLSADEWEIMKNHSVYGAEILLRSRDLNDATIRNILVAFEHHLNLDLGGYPNLTDRRDLNLYSQIVSIADCFDALTTPRAYRNRHYSPQEALGIMMEGRGTVYHPTLLKIFVSALGLYPTGSIVELDTGELAIVVRPSETVSGTTGLPQVKIFADSDGVKVSPRLVDLSRLDENGEPPMRILRGMDPGDCFESIEEYLDIL